MNSLFRALRWAQEAQEREERQRPFLARAEAEDRQRLEDMLAERELCESVEAKEAEWSGRFRQQAEAAKLGRQHWDGT